MNNDKFYINDECINCGACVDTCPVGAIEPKGAKHEIDDKCISCGSCLGICPVDAILDRIPAKPGENKPGGKK